MKQSTLNDYVKRHSITAKTAKIKLYEYSVPDSLTQFLANFRSFCRRLIRKLHLDIFNFSYAAEPIENVIQDALDELENQHKKNMENIHKIAEIWSADAMALIEESNHLDEQIEAREKRIKALEAARDAGSIFA